MTPTDHLVPLGIPGLSVPPGTHICTLFRGSAERDAILYPYLAEGLRRRDKCLCAFDAPDEAALRSEVANHLDLEAAGEQLDGEMTWALSELIGWDNLSHYEAELNRFVPKYPQVMMCLYDLDSLGGDLLVEILRTHPKVLLGGTVLENLYFVEPDDYRVGG
ncbi:MAG: MEDS domain-containing protein [Sporichthyaceae bacterium]